MGEKQRTLLAGAYHSALIQLADREGLIRVKPDTGSRETVPQKYIDDVLALLLLSDELILPVLDGDSNVEIPALSDAGLLTTRAWSFKKDLPDIGDKLGAALSDYEIVAPFVLNGVLSMSSGVSPMKGFDRVFMDLLKLSRRKFYDAVIRYAQSSLAGRPGEVEENILARTLPKPILSKFFEDPIRLKRMRSAVDSASAIVAMAAFEIDFVLGVMEISRAENASIASEHFGSGAVDDEVFGLDDATRNTRAFYILQHVLKEEGLCFPHLHSIDQTIKLRKDPHLSSLRSAVGELSSALRAGNSDVVEARQVVHKAVNAIARSGRWERPIRWVSYMSLPISTIESILHAPPVVSTGFSVLSVGLGKLSERIKNKGGWILFGSPH